MVSTFQIQILLILKYIGNNRDKNLKFKYHELKINFREIFVSDVFIIVKKKISIFMKVDSVIFLFKNLATNFIRNFIYKIMTINLFQYQ
jgi:hypothetical protein